MVTFDRENSFGLRACAPKGLLGYSQKANGEEPTYSNTLFLFFLTLIAQMLPVTGLKLSTANQSTAGVYHALRTGC